MKKAPRILKRERIQLRAKAKLAEFRKDFAPGFSDEEYIAGLVRSGKLSSFRGAAILAEVKRLDRMTRWFR